MKITDRRSFVKYGYLVHLFHTCWLNTDQYRRFRQLRKEIAKIEKEIKQLLDDYEKELVNKTRKGRLYLDVWNS
ncbi:MAG: hypothetical protein K940chlam7_01368 [Chlamydiae bacterium]|nr:hypothetical protein [Chlamydiota bacterium]